MSSRKPAAQRRAGRPATGADVYRQRIVDHYRQPRNFGTLPSCDTQCRESNFSCGDDLEFFLKIKNERIDEISFSGHGCALSVAAASLLTDDVLDRPVQQVHELTDDDVVDMLGLGALSGSRLRCATLSLKAIQQALADWSNGAAVAAKKKPAKKKVTKRPPAPKK